MSCIECDSGKWKKIPVQSWFISPDSAFEMVCGLQVGQVEPCSMPVREICDELLELVFQFLYSK